MSAHSRGFGLCLPLRQLAHHRVVPAPPLARAFGFYHCLRGNGLVPPGHMFPMGPRRNPKKPTKRKSLPASGMRANAAAFKRGQKALESSEGGDAPRKQAEKQQQQELQKPMPLSAATISNPILLQLARSSGPTLLYESASHFWMKLSAWSAAVACYSGSAINFYLAWAPSTTENLSWFIAPIYSVTALALGGLGSFFVFGAANVVKTIRAVPTAALKNVPKGFGSNARLTPLHLEIEVKPLAPFRRKPGVLLVPPEQVTLGRPLYEPRPGAHQVRRQEERDKKAQKAQWEEDKKRLLTLPFRDAWRGAKAAFWGVKRALTGGGFVKMQVGDRKCKLDMTTGWSLNGGRTLDGLVAVEKAEVPEKRR